MFKKFREIRELKETKMKMEVLLLGYLYSFMNEKEEYIESVKKILSCVKSLEDVEDIKHAVVKELANIIHEEGNKNKEVE